MTTPELQQNIDAFEAMSARLKQDYFTKHVVFHEGVFVGAYDTFHNAAEEAARRFGNGPYLIRQVGGPRRMPMPASVAYRPVHAPR